MVELDLGTGGVVSDDRSTSVVIADGAPRVVLPVISKARRLITFLIALALVGAAAFIGGTLVKAPQQSAFDAVDSQVEVTYAVEDRMVAAGVSLPGRVVAGPTQEVGSGASSEQGAGGGTRRIVTQQTLSVGQTITPGTMLGEVSGRPIISVPAGVPLYRDMDESSTGADVAAFQSALQQMGFDVEVTGEVGPRTLSAVEELYERFGDEPLSTSTISWTEFLPIQAGATVLRSAAISTVLDMDVFLATVKVSADYLLARATVIEADQLSVGQPVEVRSGTGSAQSTIVSVGEFSAPTDGSAAGRDIIVAVPEGLELTESDPVTISTSADAEPGPAVPLVALRQDSKGTYVELPSTATAGKGDSHDREKVYVTVKAQADGWAAIEPTDELPIGTEIVVSK